jgi:membrane-associated phospholipid phosphatase
MGVLIAVTTIAWLAAVLSIALPYINIEEARIWGGDIILDLQSAGDTLEYISRGFSYLGDDIAYIVVLPVIIFSCSYEIGAKTFVLFCVSIVINGLLKTLLHGPRPSWTVTQGLTCEIDSGNPSGHSQHAFAMYLWAAVCFTRICDGCKAMAAIWTVAVILAACVAASRLVVGAHFPHQVLGGSCVGIATCSMFVVLEGSERMQSFFRASLSNVKTGVLAAVLVTFLGCGLGIACWGITASYFKFPSSWVERAEATCDGKETIDEFGGVRYDFLAVGLLAAILISHAADVLPTAMADDAEMGPSPLWWRLFRGLAGIVVVGAIYFAMGALVSKDWHIVVVLILRYYLRGLLSGLAALYLLPLILVRTKCFSRVSKLQEKQSDTSTTTPEK